MWDENILKHAGCSPGVIAHCLAVTETALEFAKRIKQVPVDMELVHLGALFHDIGRARTHGIDHALVGVEIGKRIGLPAAVLNIIERHIGAGITADEAERLGLPRKDYLPATPEEKIVSYADNLTKGDRPMSYEDALARFAAILGSEHEGVSLFRMQHAEIQSWMK